MNLFVKHCLVRENLFLAFKAALVVGTLLGLINHYDMFIGGKYETVRIIKIIATYFVPFGVSLCSSAAGGRRAELISRKKD